MRFRFGWPPLVLTGAVFFSLVVSVWGEESSLKVLVGSRRPASVYDPAIPVYSVDYFFLGLLFSPLLEYSENNELVSGLAERFEWYGTEARFRMRSGLKTADGKTIDAFDAENSLKRLFLLGGGDFDALRRQLCGDAELKKLSDKCAGLEVADGGRTLVMRFKEPKPFLFHLLSDISYGIIPRGSLDGPTLKITDYRNTSGPYFVEKDAGGGKFELRANPGHYRFSEDMPQRVAMVPLQGPITNEGALEMLLDGKIDYLPNGLVRNPQDKAEFVRSNPGYRLWMSRPVRMIYIVFTERGLERLSAEERFFIARRLRRLYARSHEISETPDQIFRMEGALSRAQLIEVRDLLNGPAEGVLRTAVSENGLSLYFYNDMEEIKKWLPGLKDIPNKEYRAGGRKVDFYVKGTDICFTDDIALVSFFMEKDFFDIPAGSKEKFMGDYLAAPDKSARMAMLRELHYAALKKGKALPISLLPYASVARESWVFHYPGVSSGDDLWRLRKE